MMSDRPGSEIPKEYRQVAQYLVTRRGWGYDSGGKGHPRLYPADTTKPPYPVPTSPSRNPRAFKNWIAGIRQRGGDWPPQEEGR